MMAQKALVSVIQEGCIHGVTARKVDELVKAMGLDDVVKSEVARICFQLDEMVSRFRNRPLGGPYPLLVGRRNVTQKLSRI